MFEREAKREKILEARQREMRLKERSRSEQSKEEDGARDHDGEESTEELIRRAEADFYEMVDAELKKREKGDKQNRVSTCVLIHIIMTSDKDTHTTRDRKSVV